MRFLCRRGADLAWAAAAGCSGLKSSNLALAFAGLTLIVALASPIADPAAAGGGGAELRGWTAAGEPDAFDYTWLRDGGLRFGHEALTDMAARRDRARRWPRGALSGPDRGARCRCARRPPRSAPISRVHDGRRAAARQLLARDWTDVPVLPPCLTTALLACDAFFVDLDGDGRDEILLAYGTDARWWAGVMRQGDGGGWYVAGTMAAPPCPGSSDGPAPGISRRSSPNNLARIAGGWLRAAGNAGPKPASACPALSWL